MSYDPVPGQPPYQPQVQQPQPQQFGGQPPFPSQYQTQPPKQTGSKKLPLIAGVAVGVISLFTIISVASGGGGTATADPSAVATTSAPAAPSTSAPMTTEPAQPVVQKDATYESAEDLYNAVASADADLSGEYKADSPSTANSETSGNNGLGDDETSFFVYADRATLLDDVNAAHLGDHADSVLVGPNWMIVSNHTDEIQPSIGGEHPSWAAKAVQPKPTPKPKPTYSREQQEAIEAAESYLDSGHFSRLGLIDQLHSEYGEGFPKKIAIFAVDHVHADWNAEAVEAANSYLESGHFSRRALIAQLESPYGEHFTHKQAVYGVNHSEL